MEPESAVSPAFLEKGLTPVEEGGAWNTAWGGMGGAGRGAWPVVGGAYEGKTFAHQTSKQ